MRTCRPRLGCWPWRSWSARWSLRPGGDVGSAPAPAHTRGWRTPPTWLAPRQLRRTLRCATEHSQGGNDPASGTRAQPSSASRRPPRSWNHGFLRPMRPLGLEPRTLGLEGRCSIHLSYRRVAAPAPEARADCLKLPSAARESQRPYMQPAPAAAMDPGPSSPERRPLRGEAGSAQPPPHAALPRDPRPRVRPLRVEDARRALAARGMVHRRHELHPAVEITATQSAEPM